MDRERPGPGHDDGGSAAWGLLIAIPMMLLCCGGPLLAGLLGAGALAGFWARGYGYLGIALLVLAAAAVALWRSRHTRRGTCCAPTAAVHASGAAAADPASEAVIDRPAQKP